MSIANLFIMFIFCDRLMSQGHFLLRGFLRYAHEVVPFEKVFSIFVRIPEIERWFQIPSRLFSWTSFIFILFGLFTSVSVRKIDIHLNASQLGEYVPPLSTSKAGLNRTVYN